MRRNDPKLRQPFVQLTEPGDDLVGQRLVVVTVPQNERFADALFKSACIIDGVAHVKQAAVGRQVHEDTNAPGGMSAQRYDDHRSVLIKVGAFVEGFIRLRLKTQSWRAGRREFWEVRSK